MIPVLIYLDSFGWRGQLLRLARGGTWNWRFIHVRGLLHDGMLQIQCTGGESVVMLRVDCRLLLVLTCSVNEGWMSMFPRTTRPVNFSRA